MVKLFSPADKKALACAIADAEHITGAELVVVAAPASDGYTSYLLLYGLILGSVIDTGLWLAKTVTAFPLFLGIQVAMMAMFCFIPPLRHLCIRLVPARIRHHRAAHRASEEYLRVSRHVYSTAPVVLLYISLAEHYAHILTSRSVREHIPDERWNAVIKTLTGSLPSQGLLQSCIQAITHAAKLLSPHFPAVVQGHQQQFTFGEDEQQP